MNNLNDGAVCGEQHAIDTRGSMGNMNPEVERYMIRDVCTERHKAKGYAGERFVCGCDCHRSDY